MTTIAEVLHLAADKYLAANTQQYHKNKDRFSCTAVFEASRALRAENLDDIYDGLEAMGCPTSSRYAFQKLGYEDIREFGNMRVFPETQGARFMWLKFAALIAEEQGV